MAEPILLYILERLDKSGPEGAGAHGPPYPDCRQPFSEMHLSARSVDRPLHFLGALGGRRSNLVKREGLGADP